MVLCRLANYYVQWHHYPEFLKRDKTNWVVVDCVVLEIIVRRQEDPGGGFRQGDIAGRAPIRLVHQHNACTPARRRPSWARNRFMAGASRVISKARLR